MRSYILYYPYISLPNDSWTKSVILYNDGISSILPYPDYKVDDFGKALIENGEYRPLYASDILSKINISKFVKDITRKLESEMFQELLQSNREKNSEWKVKTEFYIHNSKIIKDVLDLFVEKGFATKDADKDGFIPVDRTASNTYFSLLCRECIKVQDDIYTMATNDLDVDNYIFNDDQVKPAIGFRIIDALPMVRDDVPVDKLLKFKSKYSDELINFRKVLNNYQFKKENYDGEIKIDLYKLKTELESEIINIRNILKYERIMYYLGSFKSLLSLSVAGFVVGEKLGSEELGSTGGGLISLGIDAVSAYITRGYKQKNNPYSYVYFAQKEGIFN